MASTKVTIELTKEQADAFIQQMVLRKQLGKMEANTPLDRICIEIMVEIAKDRGVKP